MMSVQSGFYEEEKAVLWFTVATLGIIFILISSILLFVINNTFPEIIRSSNEKLFMDEKRQRIPFPEIMDDWSVHLSVVIPAYNESKRLPTMLNECLGFLNDRQSQQPDFRFEVIIVNDGSTDNTADVALTYTDKYGSQKVRLLNLDKNRGKGGAVRLGVLSSRGALILFADADGATSFKDISKLENELSRIIGVDCVHRPQDVEKSVAVICGSRAHLEQAATAKRSYFRTILMHGFHLLVRIFVADTVKDTQCGFKMFTREAAIQCFYNLHVEKWAFDVELLSIAKKFHIPISEMPVNWTEIEGSKIIPVFSWLQMALDLFLLWLRYFMGVWDLNPITH